MINMLYGPVATINVDEDVINADWVKQTWDLAFEYGSDEFLDWLKTQGMTLTEFKKLPAYTLAIKEANA